MNKIAVVIPTIRMETYVKFLEKWKESFEKNDVTLVTVFDGEKPHVVSGNIGFGLEEIMGEYSDIIYQKNDGVRNLGFAYVAKYLPHIDTIISFDDDVEPSGSTIEDHLAVLGTKVSISWLSTASEYTRGFPYKARQEAEVVLSHGVWKGVADWDAPTQLIHGNKEVTFYKGIVPKGIQFPLCAMNFAFKRELLPYVYQAPMGPRIGLDRFADIWGGIEMKKDIDNIGMAAVTGYAAVQHKRASNVWDNLIKEAKGLKMNENYGQDPYFKIFFENRKRWQDFIRSRV